MNGDQSAQTLDRGANSALNDQDFTSGNHESSNKTAPAGEKTTTPAFSKDGAIGSAFKADGAIGGTAQKIGGPFDKSGVVGKHFNADGKIGGVVQGTLGENKEGV